jgi:hypothetical protein
MREMAARIGNAVGGAFEGDALAYLTSIYKDPAKPENVRMANTTCGSISRGHFDPPQTFVLRADEILGNERQTVWRSGRALQA